MISSVLQKYKYLSSLDYNVSELCNLNGKFIHFSFPDNESASSGSRNVFPVLMPSACTCNALPQKLDSNNARGDNLLYNDVIDFPVRSCDAYSECSSDVFKKVSNLLTFLTCKFQLQFPM